MKRNLIRVSVGFATYDDNDLNSFAMLVCVCLVNNMLFPDLPVNLTVLNAKLKGYQEALLASAGGGTKATAAKKEAQADLVVALKQNAYYIQSLNLANISDVLSSGYDVIIPNNVSSPLAVPSLLSLEVHETTQLLLRAQSVPNARVYHVQYSIGTGPWVEAGIFNNARSIVLTGLTPGVTYAVRLRAVGGSTQFSGWSSAISRMCL